MWIVRFLRWFCADTFLDEIEGDLHEMFQEEVELYGLSRARRRFLFTSIRYIQPFFFGKKQASFHLSHSSDMFRHYFKISFRHLFKYRFYSLINIVGLALGMACTITVLLYVHDESSYDSYHHEADRLYRLSIRGVEISSGDDNLRATTPILWAPALQQDYPEVEAYTRFVQLARPENPWELSYGEEAFFESDILYADSSVFQLFNWPLQQGDAKTALSQPQSIILTEEMATKYFGEEDPMGQLIKIDPRLRNDEGQLTGQTFDYKITGIMANIPRRSHFTFDFLLPSKGLNAIYGGDITTGAGMNSWFWRGTVAHTYLQLKKGSDPSELESKFEEFQDRYVGDATRSRGYYYAPFLQRIDKIYLEGNMGGQLSPVGDETFMYMFSIIALFILCIACINFMNLSTARSATRAKEVGIRKVVGAYRKQIISQFLGESILISLIAFCFAILMARFILPIFYAYLGKEWTIDYMEEAPFLLGLILVSVLVGIFSGSYPAIFLSRFRPVQVLKGIFSYNKSGTFLRKGLVVFQFVITAFLIIATLTVFKQLNFMQDYELGFDQEHVVVLPPDVARPLSSHYEAIKKELLNHPNIQDVTMASAVPGQGGGGDIYVAKGAAVESSFGLAEAFVDYNFVEMFGLELLAGRNFSRDLSTDLGLRAENGRLLEVTAILNEEAVKSFGWSSPEEAIGKQIIRDPNAGDWTANVIGVMKDFHARSLHEPIPPLAIILLPSYSLMAVKVRPDDMQETISFIESSIQSYSDETAFTYNFLDETFKEQYELEQSLSEVFSSVAFLAIFIACMGLLGLAAFTTSRRIKEIGIRKVLGASVKDIVLLLSGDFTKLVLIAVVLAIPLAWYVAEKWLEEFAYRIDLGIGMFVMACLLAVAIAWLTISFQMFQAARRNPINSLRSE